MSDQETEVSPYLGASLRERLNLQAASGKSSRRAKCALRSLGREKQTGSPFRYPPVWRGVGIIEFLGNATVDTHTGKITTTNYMDKKR